MVDTNRFRDSTSKVDSFGQLVMSTGSTGSPFINTQLKMASILNTEALEAGQVYQLEYPDSKSEYWRSYLAWGAVAKW